MAFVGERDLTAPGPRVEILTAGADWAALRLMRLLILGLCACLAVCASGAEVSSNELEKIRAERVQRLTAPDGWLTLIGLHWLNRGENTVGTAPDNTLRLAAGPAHFGRVNLAPNGRVTVQLADEAAATIQGQATRTGELSYGTAQPTLVVAGTVSFFVIQRGDKIGLRVKDSAAVRRRDFVGLDYFPCDASWRIEAQWVPFAEPRPVPITNMLGQTTPAPVPGKAVFTREGRTYELLPIDEGPAEPLFFVIADATSGDETYAAARFLYAERPREGKIVLDFNRAENPPCAFTPFATCPLPPSENRFPVRIAAGEKNYRGAH